MKNIAGITLLMVVLVASLAGTADSQAGSPYSDLTPNEMTFTGRRGVVYTATWDPSTYEITFSTPDGTFPWDWISFVGSSGAVALNGYPNTGETLAQSDPAALEGAQPGDLLRIKGQGILGLAHLTKIGLVIGSGSSAQRGWMSDGEISEYTVAPGWAGYRVSLFGRNIQVRVTSLNPKDYYSIGAVEVQLDDASNARLVFATDLEPVMDYSSSVEFTSRNDTSITFDSANQVLVGTQGGSYPAYVYTSSALHSWSGSNLSFSDYLNADVLDGSLHPGTSDARVALSVSAQPRQYFYVGSHVLTGADRTDPTTGWQALTSHRLEQLEEMPVIDSVALPQFKFVQFFSNLILSYLVNPNGSLFYTDKALFYGPDAVMPVVVTPHLLPGSMRSSFEQGLVKLAGQQFGSSVSSSYAKKIDTNANAALPGWYSGNFPDLIYYRPDGTRVKRETYSDIYLTAEFINSVYGAYLASGDLAFTESLKSAVNNAVNGLLAFDAHYDSQYGQDGNLFPNILIPMGDLGKIAGEYPGETSQMIYALQDAAELRRLWGDQAGADDLLNNYIQPMRADFDNYFWDASRSFYLPRADENSQTRSPGSTYQDFWAHTVFVPLRGDLGHSRLQQLLQVITGSTFFEPGGDVHWLAKGSENFATPGRWGLSPLYTNGWGMEGGYLALPNAIPALGYYQLGQVSEASSFAEQYFEKWIQYGPHETMMEWDGQVPGRFGESSLYIEAAAATTWLLQSALGIQVEGTEVTIAPLLEGQFVARNVSIHAAGKTAVLEYSRDASGRESLNVVSNTGLTIIAPQVQSQATPTATPTGAPGDPGQPPAGEYTLHLALVMNAAPSRAQSDLPLSSGSLAQAAGVNDTMYVSTMSSGMVGGVSFADEDILAYDVASVTWSLYLDGSDVGLDVSDLGGFHLRPDGSILFTLSSAVSIPDVGFVDDSDVIRFIPASLGENTSGHFEWYFDGSDVGLLDNSEAVDAIGITPEGDLLVSVLGAIIVDGVSGYDEDLVAFTPSSLGANTAGSWRMYFDGSDAGLEAKDEDTDAAWVDPATGQIYLSTLGVFSVTGASGDYADILECTPLSLGEATVCSYALYWSGTASGLSGQNIDGFAVVKGSGGPAPTGTPTPTPLPPTSTPTATPPPATSTPTATFTPPAASPTPTATYSPTAVWTPTATGTGQPSTPTATFTPLPATATPTTPPPTATLPPGSTRDVIYISSTTGGTVGGTGFADEDILAYDTSSGLWSMYFDGSDLSLEASDISAFDIQPDGSILISLSTAVSVPGMGFVDDSDIIRFIPAATGPATDGTLEWYFDGSDVGLLDKSEGIDAIGFSPSGDLLISVIGSINVAGASGYDEDLAAFTPDTLGESTSGTWRFYFDGGDADLAAKSEDVNGTWTDPDTGEIYLTVLESFSVPGVSGDYSDIFICTPASLGSTTTCTYRPYWDGSAHGFAGEVVDGIDIHKNAPPPPPPPTPCPAGPTRIMPLGDSITRGDGSTFTNGYRRRLQLLLEQNGYQVDFTGGLINGLDDFDRDHEGHGGWHAEGGSEGGIASFVYDWLVANPADVVLLHIGTNDISNGDQSAAEVAHILDEVDRYNPNITVVLARIINRQSFSAATTQYNNEVAAMAQARIASGDKIVIVDMESALDYSQDLADNVHPNDSGYFKMAQVWLDGLQTFLTACR